MSSDPIEELAVPYDPSEVVARMQHRRGMVRMRIVSLIITIAIMVGLYFFFSDRQGPGWFVVYGIALAVAVTWVAGTFLAYRLARKEVQSMPAGTALRINRHGVEIGGQPYGWSDVTSIAVVRGKLGRGPLIQVNARSGEQVALPLRHIRIPIATVDSTARAYSAGRHGVDLSALDN